MPQLSRKRAERRKNKKQNKVKMKQTDVERHREHVNAAINRAVPENESKRLWPTLK